MRLGSGQKGSPIDFHALKSHAFFNGLNFDSIKEGKISPPIPREKFENAMVAEKVKEVSVGDMSLFGNSHNEIENQEPMSSRERAVFKGGGLEQNNLEINSEVTKLFMDKT